MKKISIVCLFLTLVMLMASCTSEPKKNESSTPPKTVVRADFFEEAGSLVLTSKNWPTGFKHEESKINSDDSFTYQEQNDNSGVIYLERSVAVDEAPDIDKIAEIFMQSGQEDTPEVNFDETMTEKITYPTYGVVYTTGQNEDTRYHRAFFVAVDGWYLIADFSAPSDLYEDYESQIERWAAGLTLEYLGEE